MTQEELVKEHHFAQTGAGIAKPQHHARVSIEYAISVIEELRDNDTRAAFYYEDAIPAKIKELEKLL
jgi:hypothetical protein